MYSDIYQEVAMDTAKLFRNGRSQAVRLPKAYALPGEEVYVKKLQGVVVLISKTTDPWQSFADSLEKFSWTPTRAYS